MPVEHCGLFGIFNHPEASRLTYFGLYAQQHRGQQSGGIAVWNGEKIRDYCALGLVHDIFTEEHLKHDLAGNTAIGHVRYAGASKANIRNAEPFVVRRNGLELAIAHNGALVNSRALRKALEERGAIFQTETDSEIFAHLIVRNMAKMPLEEAILESCRRVSGAYSLVILANDKLIGLRDPHGVRPLAIGQREDSFVLASESCAFDLLEADFIRSVEPGEMVVIESRQMTSLKSYRILPKESSPEPRRCIFELIYFARPDSRIFRQNVYMARKNMGIHLAKESPVEADLVMPFPDSGIYCAVGYAQASGIPYEHALIRNHYVGRTFIQPTQDMRDFAVRIKLNPVRDAIKGKRIIIVDDSIVRGTTMRTRVKKLRELGAAEVHCRISCPPVKFPCFYGVDFASRGELIAANHSLEDIKTFLGLDSLHFLSLEGLLASVHDINYCLACFNGEYAIPVEDM